MRGQPYPIPVPQGGVRYDKSPTDIPDGSLWRGNNVVARFGEITNRPGVDPLLSAGPGGTIMGGTYLKFGDGTEAIVAANLTKWYKATGAGWTDISGAVTFTGSVNDPTMFTVFPSGGSTYLIGVNNHDAPYKWNGTGNITAVGGSPPIARDVTVAANRVVYGNLTIGGTTYPSMVWPSDFNNAEAYTAANQVLLTDTDDTIVGVRAYGRTQFAIYKDQSLWAGIGQSGTFPFRYELVSQQPGPVSPAVIVPVGNAAYYLGSDARIYRFDGYSVNAVSDPVDKYLQANLATLYKQRCTGVYMWEDDSLWYFFPSLATEPDFAVSYHRATGTWYTHQLGIQVSAAWDGQDLSLLTWTSLTGKTWSTLGQTYPTWTSMGGTHAQRAFVGSPNGQVYRWKYGDDDAGTPIAMSWELPPKSYTGMAYTQNLDAIESSFEQVAGGPAVTVDYATSAADAETNASYTNVGTHDTTLTTRQLIDLKQNRPSGRLFAFRWSATTSKTLHFRGAVPFFYKENVS